MTRDEADRIDRLISDLAGWRVDMKDDLIDAVRTHQATCLEMHLGPMRKALDDLVNDARYRQRSIRTLKYLISVCISLVVGVVVPLLVHFIR